MAIERIDLGDIVLCDYCNEDFTDSDACGGCTVGTYAVCPACMDALKHPEEIDLRCPPDMRFGDWVRKVLRGGQPGSIRILSGDDLPERFR